MASKFRRSQSNQESVGCAEQTILIHGGPALQLTGLKGTAIIILVPDSTAHLQGSSGVHASMIQGCFGSKNGYLSVSGVTTICLTQCNTSPSHRVDRVVDCGLWNVGPLLFNGCAKLLDIGRNWNTLLYTPIQSIPNMLNG